MKKKLVKKKVVEKVLAWHFTKGMKLRDGRKLIPGKTYSTWMEEGWGNSPRTRAGDWRWRFAKRLELCKAGLHASVKVIDALRYCHGSVVSRVECSGTIIHDPKGDKLVCSRRKVLWSVPFAKVNGVIGNWLLHQAMGGVNIDKDRLNSTLESELERRHRWQEEAKLKKKGKRHGRR